MPSWWAVPPQMSEPSRPARLSKAFQEVSRKPGPGVKPPLLALGTVRKESRERKKGRQEKSLSVWRSYLELSGGGGGDQMVGKGQRAFRPNVLVEEDKLLTQAFLLASLFSSFLINTIVKALSHLNLRTDEAVT